MADRIEVHFKRLRVSGATLVVVAIGMEIHGAMDREPLAALDAAAQRASDGLTKRGQPVDPSEIVARGHEELRARGGWSAAPRAHADPSRPG